MTNELNQNIPVNQNFSLVMQREGAGEVAIQRANAEARASRARASLEASLSVEKMIPQFESWLERTAEKRPDQAAKLFIEFMQYATPKLSVKIGDEGEGVTNQVNVFSTQQAERVLDIFKRTRVDLSQGQETP